jgi:hypothetical protein
LSFFSCIVRHRFTALCERAHSSASACLHTSYARAE